MEGACPPTWTAQNWQCWPNWPDAPHGDTIQDLLVHNSATSWEGESHPNQTASALVGGLAAAMSPMLRLRLHDVQTDATGAAWFDHELPQLPCAEDAQPDAAPTHGAHWQPRDDHEALLPLQASQPLHSR